MLSPLGRRFGYAAIFIIVVGTLLVCISMALLVSLWIGDSNSHIWKSVVAAGSLNVTVTILSTILQNTINLQVGVATAMVAAIVLEKQDVLLPEAAPCLAVRSSFSPWNLITLLRSGSPWRGRKAGIRLSSMTALTVVLFAAACIVQFSSVLLISDIGLGTVVGKVNVSYLAYAINVTANTSNMVPLTAIDSTRSAWQSSPATYPAFAEYREEPPNYASDGIDDTGRTLRAFLPYRSSEKRQSLHSYDGHATVLDARVTCQAPNITSLNISHTVISANESLFTLSGQAGPFNVTQRLVNADLSNFTINPIPFNCVTPKANSVGNRLSNRSLSSFSVCKLTGGGSAGLVSEFESLYQQGDESDSDPATKLKRYTGAAYLILNVTSSRDNGTSKSTSDNVTVHRGQWVDIAYGSESPSDYVVMSLTLCYGAFDTADLNISASSSKERTEPVPATEVGSATGAFDMASVSRQLAGGNGTTHTLAEEERGILRLEPLQSWVANSTQEGGLGLSKSYLGGTTRGEGNHSVTMWPAWAASSFADGPVSANLTTANPSQAFLFQYLLQNGYSPAHALQALLTVLSGMSYYDSLASFNAYAPASQNFFVPADVPVRSHGIVAVAVAVMLHLPATLAIVVVFARVCRVSAIGSNWQGLLHAARADAASAELFSFDALDEARDSDFRDAVAKLGKDETRVGVVRSDKDGRVGLRVRWAGSGSSSSNSSSSSSFIDSYSSKEFNGSGVGDGGKRGGSIAPPSPSDRPRKLVWSRFFVVRNTDRLASHGTPYIGS